MRISTRRRLIVRKTPSIEPLEPRQLLASAGSIDPTFGNAGELTLQLQANWDFLDSGSSKLAALESDGKIVLAGSIATPTTTDFEVVRLNTNGSLDTTFGQGGRADFTVGTGTGNNDSSYLIARALLIQPDGMIDVAGTFSNATSTNPGSYGILQVTPTGTIDTSFGTNGFARLPATYAGNEPFLSVKALTMDSSGNLIVAGEDSVAVGSSTLPGFYAARFHSNGTLDTTFGTNGIASVPVALAGYADLTTDSATSVVVQPSGRIIVGGDAIAQNPGVGGGPILEDEAGVVIGLTASGRLDPTFGGNSGNGEVILPANPSTPGVREIFATAVQADGKIVLAGSDATAVTDFTSGQLTRLNADGTLDTTFGNAGMVAITSGLTPGGLTIQANGQILVPGSGPLPADPALSTAAVARYSADGSPDSSFGNGTTPGLATYPEANSSYNGSLSTALINSQGRIVLIGSTGIVDNRSGEPSPYFEVIRAYDQPTATPADYLPPADYDGSGKTNLAVYLAAQGEFAYRPTNGGPDVLVPFGLPGIGQTIPAPGDYTGSGQTEIAAYLPSLAIYAYRPANGGPDVLESFGIAGPGQSIPAPGDYLGTGVDDLAIYLPAFGAFAIRNPAGGPDEIVPFGFAGMGQTIPAPGDYFGTGQTDIAAYLPSIGSFAIRNPAGGPDEIIPFGIPGAGNSIPIPGDYDDSGKTELAVYFPKLGVFAYRPADGGPDVIIPFGSAGDGTIPVPGDYNGSGYDQIAVYDPNDASFAYRVGPDVIESFGAAGKGASLPSAAPAFSNIAISHPKLSALSSPATSVSSESTKVPATTTSVPGGPMAKLAAQALVRVATTPPAQAEPSKSIA